MILFDSNYKAVKFFRCWIRSIQFENIWFDWFEMWKIIRKIRKKSVQNLFHSTPPLSLSQILSLFSIKLSCRLYSIPNPSSRQTKDLVSPLISCCQKHQTLHISKYRKTILAMWNHYMIRIFDTFKIEWILPPYSSQRQYVMNHHFKWTLQFVFPTFCLFAHHFGFWNFCIFCKDMQKSVGFDEEISLRHDASAQANCTFLWNSWDLNHWRRREAFSDNFQQNRDEQKSRENNGGSHPFAFSTPLFENYLQCCQIFGKYFLQITGILAIISSESPNCPIHYAPETFKMWN